MRVPVREGKKGAQRFIEVMAKLPKYKQNYRLAGTCNLWVPIQIQPQRFLHQNALL